MRSVLTAFCLFASTAHAVPAQFTHQGRLLDSDGAPLGDEATIMFRVTDSEVGGTALWEESITVPLTTGFYSAVLGADEDNPLDTDVLSQAPVWLELQLDGEPAMFPRSPINAVPYATMATVAEELSGGPVDASQIAVDGTPVVNELGEWVGPAPTVNWTDIEGMPEDFADGIDDDTDTDTDSFAALGTSCLDGDIPVWDSVLVEWVCGIDAVLTADEVDTIVADNGYAMESEVFSSSFLDLTDVPDGLDDGDDNTQLSESEVDAMAADNGYAMAADAFSRLFSDLIGIPEDLADGDDNTQLTEDEVDAIVADNGYAFLSEIFSGSFLDLADLPEDLADGDDNTDTLSGLDCAEGEIAVQTPTGWMCSTFAEQLDLDGDGAMVWSDCDDADPTVGNESEDADCDGTKSTIDCDDSDPTATTLCSTKYETVYSTGFGGGIRWKRHSEGEFDDYYIIDSVSSVDACAEYCEADAGGFDCAGFMYKIGAWSGDSSPYFDDESCSLLGELHPMGTGVEGVVSAEML